MMYQRSRAEQTLANGYVVLTMRSTENLAKKNLTAPNGKNGGGQGGKMADVDDGHLVKELEMIRLRKHSATGVFGIGL